VAQTGHLPRLAHRGHQRGGHQRDDFGAVVITVVTVMTGLDEKNS